MNGRERNKAERIDWLKRLIGSMKDSGEIINKEKLINMLIVNRYVSKKIATEEVEAVLDFMEI